MIRKILDKGLTALVVLLAIAVVAVYLNMALVIRAENRLMNEIWMEVQE